MTRVVHENIASRPIDDSVEGHRVAAPQSRQVVSRALGHLRSSEAQLGGRLESEQAHDRLSESPSTVNVEAPHLREPFEHALANDKLEVLVLKPHDACW